MLCLADRNFFGYKLWKAAAEKADLLWRVKKNLTLEREKTLPDGSYLSHVYPSAQARRRRRDGIAVRVIEFVLDDPRATAKPPEVYRLITTILDHEEAPALELAVLYCQRWEFETTNDELKTHQRGAQEILRSGTPDGVRQEIYAFFLTHYAIRSVMYDAAQEAHLDPDRLSFTHTLHVLQRKVIAQGLFPLDDSLRHAILSEILEEILPPRTYRSNPRVIKRKMSKFPVKRRHHCTPSLTSDVRPSARCV